MRATVDAFFDGVMVNAEEADLRLNRLGLLATLHQAMNRVADLSRLADLIGNAMKLVILDRDGTINADSDDFIKSPEEWTPLPGALEAIARLNHAGWHAVIASNQSGLGRGLFDVASLNAMHAKMHKMLAAAGRSHRCRVLLPAQPRRGLPLPQAHAGPVRADRRALRRGPRRRADGGRRRCATCRPARPWAASRTWC